MQRAPVTVEELLLEKAIKDECQWENLPRRLQQTVPSKEEWISRTIEYCVKKRLQWNSCLARKFCKESEYYENMMRYLRKNLALFPYHLVDYVCRVMRLSPFRYYCDMLFEVMKNEQPYDSIPNFSAADALRLTGIGRNEFIDIMNKCRSKVLLRFFLYVNVIDGGQWRKAKNPPYDAALKHHGTAVLHKLVMAVVKKSANTICMPDI
ncbi:hypothetical protein KIW84_020802 [Lathyrus oleraceus]|uniref:FAM91 N-terminal domain-containing protein n=1 Tax=Pisum sativum TaxID=3888 RepID=A0A9D5B8E3_PEA|nr:hypothetical protein KIW84_020802 [Pisum sativum]